MSQTPFPEKPAAWSYYGGIALLVAGVLVLFGRILGHPFVAFDDVEYILKNPQVINPGNSLLDQLFTPHVGYIVPVAVNFEAFLYWIGDGSPGFFHGAALLLHAAFVVQLFLLILGLSRRFWLSAIAGLLFAMHPLVVEPVSWAICLKDLLMANLLLGATRCFLSLATRPPGSSRGVGLAVGAAGLSILAMFAKPSAVLVGFAWLGFLGAGWLSARGDPAAKPGKPHRVATIVTLVVAASGIIIGLMSWFAHNTILGDTDVPGSSVLVAPFRVLGEQITHIIWPVSLHPLYSFRLDSGWISAGTWLGFAAVIAWFLWVYSVRKRPLWLLFPLMAALVYLPTSSILPFKRMISDSYMYFPLAMLTVSMAVWLARVFSKIRVRWVQPVGLVFLSLATGVFALRSSQQIDRWEGGKALWRPVIQEFPGCDLAYFLAADEYFSRRQFDDAVSAFRHGYQLRYAPEYLVKFGMALFMARQLEQAECVLIESIYRGEESQLALHNYAMLLSYQLERGIAYPEHAKFLIPKCLQAAGSGGFGRLPGMIERLRSQLGKLGGEAAGHPDWPVRNCAILELGFNRPHKESTAGG